MLFAHGPAGFIANYFFGDSSKKKIYLWVAFIFGIFPDFDVFYYYFFNATSGHRENFTHTLLPYIILALIVAFFSKRLALAIFFGIFSHLFLDSLGFGVMWLWPFSHEMFGLVKLSFFEKFLSNNFFVVNFFIEFLLVITFTFFLLRSYGVKNKWLNLLWIFPPIIFCLLCFINLHMYHSNGAIRYGDIDVDGIINKDDPDIDNDGVANIYDLDIDADSIKNIDELMNSSKQFKDVWYDYSESKFLEIFSRAGFLNNFMAVRRVLEDSGLFLRQEFSEDYRNNPSGYRNKPEDSNFDLNVENLIIFAQHRELLVEEANLGDIIVYDDNLLAIVTKVEGEKIFVSEVTKNFRGEREFTSEKNYIIRFFGQTP